jgi:hypothetical protein
MIHPVRHAIRHLFEVNQLACYLVKSSPKALGGTLQALDLGLAILRD